MSQLYRFLIVHLEGSIDLNVGKQWFWYSQCDPMRHAAFDLLCNPRFFKVGEAARTIDVLDCCILTYVIVGCSLDFK